MTRKDKLQVPPEKMAFEMFAQVYPHEAAEMDWPRFVAYMKSKNPLITEVEIIRLLKETEDA
jgi:hypothetical protein